MTDYEKLKLLLTEFGVGFDESENEFKIISLIEGGTKVGGYTGFYVDYKFSKDGKFIGVNIWE